MPNGVITVDPSGLATASSPGAATITATKGTITGSDTLSVVLPSLKSITLSPQSIVLTPNHSVQLTALGTFTDGTTQDLSGLVTWSTTPNGVITVNPSGLATASSPGAATITATKETIMGSDTLSVVLPSLVSISLSPRGIILTPHHSVQLNAIGAYSDSSRQDISDSVNWVTSPHGVVAVDHRGVATGEALGTATITAVSNNISATNTARVVAPTLQSIVISTGQTSIPLGDTKQFSALGNYTDGSSQDLTRSVRWVSSDPTIVELSSAGMATANALGAVNVTASSGAVSSTAPVRVSPAVAISLTVAPKESILAVDGIEQLTAVAKFSDGTTQEVTASATWSSGDPTVAYVNRGSVLANKVGIAAISVTSGSLTASANVAVKPVMAISYFSNAHTSSFADATVRLTNPGVSSGSVCTEIYVFDQDQQLSECCGCRLSADGLRVLSLNTDLTGNPLTGVPSRTGVLKIVSADVNVNPSCNPTAIVPKASFIGWSTNIQKGGASAFAITETTFQQTALGDDELSALQNECSYASSLGSGKGVCSCGTSSVTPAGARRPATF
jgi:hypothetical protein